MKPNDSWGQAVHAAGRCAVGIGCDGPLEAHHLISRSHKATRNAVEGGVLLCARHHRLSNKLSPHGAPRAFREWLKINRPEQAEWVAAHRWKIKIP